MSIRYMGTVWDVLTHLSGPETLVLLALADFASDDTRECWPSMRTIARRARVDERSARRIIRRLERRELLEVALGGHQYGIDTASRYRLKFAYDGEHLKAPEPKLSPRGTAGPPTKRTRGTVDAARGTVRPPQGGPYDPPIRNMNRHRTKDARAREERLKNASEKNKDVQSLRDILEQARKRDEKKP